MSEWSITSVEQDPSGAGTPYSSGAGLGQIIGLWVMSGDVENIGGEYIYMDVYITKPVPGADARPNS
jgi:hypothetical protein